MKKKAISFFSNVGIGDAGLEAAGIEVIYANELLKERALTYQANFPYAYVENKNILDLTEDDFAFIENLLNGEELFLLIATPPCQGFSTLGKRNENDIRNQLIKPVVSIIERLQPKWVLLENVSTFIRCKIPNSTEIVDNITDKDDTILIKDFIHNRLPNYTIEMYILNAMNYGIPQSRKRLFTLMNNKGIAISKPPISHCNKDKKLKDIVDLRNAIGWLPPLQDGESSPIPYHSVKKANPNHVKWLSATPEGKSAKENKDIQFQPTTIDKTTGKLRPIRSYMSTYARMSWDKPAPTLTMSSGNMSGTRTVHPVDNRVLSIKECMIIQTLPEWYTFPIHMSENKIRETLGEAIPSLLVEKIAQHILFLDKMNKGD